MINITVNIQAPEPKAEVTKLQQSLLKKKEKQIAINAEMLKMMKKEKEPVFEQGKELKADKYIYGQRAD